jgi:hypothetical protein
MSESEVEIRFMKLLGPHNYVLYTYSFFALFVDWVVLTCSAHCSLAVRN